MNNLAFLFVGFAAVSVPLWLPLPWWVCAAVSAPFLLAWCLLGWAMAPFHLCACALGLQLLPAAAGQLGLGPLPWRALLALARGEAEPVDERVHRATAELLLDQRTDAFLSSLAEQVSQVSSWAVLAAWWSQQDSQRTSRENLSGVGDEATSGAAYIAAVKGASVASWLALWAGYRLCRAPGGTALRAHASLQSLLTGLMTMLAATGFGVFALMVARPRGGVFFLAVGCLAVLAATALFNMWGLAERLASYAARLNELQGASEPAKGAAPASAPHDPAPSKGRGAATEQLGCASAPAGEAALGMQSPAAGAAQAPGGTGAPGGPQPAGGSSGDGSRLVLLFFAALCVAVFSILFAVCMVYVAYLLLRATWRMFDAAAAALSSPQLAPLAWKLLWFDAAAFAQGAISPGVAAVAAGCAFVTGGCLLLVAALFVKVGASRFPTSSCSGIVNALSLPLISVLWLAAASWLGSLSWVLACRSRAGAMAALTLSNASHAYLVWGLMVRLQAWDKRRRRAVNPAAPRVGPAAV